MKTDYDPKWSLQRAIIKQVEREDTIIWARRPLKLQKPLSPTVELKTSLTGDYGLWRGVYKESMRWLP